MVICFNCFLMNAWSFQHFFGFNSGCNDVVDLLIKNGADLNTKNSFGHTALYAAAMNGKLDLVEKYFKSSTH